MTLLTEHKQLGERGASNRLADIKRFGTCSMSYSALADGMKEFRHPSFEGFVPCNTASGVDFVLSDPITPKYDRLIATEKLLERGKPVIFCQATYEYAHILQFLGLRVSGFGVEHKIALKEFEVTWKIRRGLKRFLSKLSNQGYYTYESNADREDIKLVNYQWLMSKSKGRELRFLARPFTGNIEEDVRTFCMYQGKELIGFCAFDPVYSNKNDGQIRSYVLQHLRVKDNAPQGSQDFLILKALFQFKDEGIKEASLGLSPLYEMDHTAFKDSIVLGMVLSLFSKTNQFYHFSEVGQHKSRFRGQKVQTFMAATNPLSWRTICGLLQVNNLI